MKDGYNLSEIVQKIEQDLIDNDLYRNVVNGN